MIGLLVNHAIFECFRLVALISVSYLTSAYCYMDGLLVKQVVMFYPLPYGAHKLSMVARCHVYFC